MEYPNLRIALDKARLQHYQLAQRLGLSESGLSRRLTGRKPFTAEEREAIVRVLEDLGLVVDPGWLFISTLPLRTRSRAEYIGPPPVLAVR